MGKGKTIEITLTDVEVETLIQCLRYHDRRQVDGALKEGGYVGVDIYETCNSIENKIVEVF